LTEHLGISPKDLQSENYILEEGKALGRLTSEFYRNRPISEGLGFHLASETTSSREFVHFLNGFRKHKDHYGIQQDGDPVLDFFYVHTLVEPLHKSNGRKIIELYLERDPSIVSGVRAGAFAFMDGFGDIFGALNRRIYNE